MAADETGKHKGRPQSAPIPYPAGPIDTWLDELSPTAHHILGAARQLLLAKGFEALTLEAVALESGESRATITRHFGSKAGLVQALYDDVGDAIFQKLSERIAALPAGDERLHVLIRGYSKLASDRQHALGTFEIAPHIIRDPILRERHAALYAWYVKIVREKSGMAAALGSISAYEDRGDVEALPALILAVIDGMSLQVSLDPSSVDCDRVFALLDLCVTAVLDGRLRTGGRLSASDSD